MKQPNNNDVTPQGLLILTDSSPMPFGVHKGKPMQEVPAGYLIFLTTQVGWNIHTPVGKYIQSNLEVLKSQARTDKNLRR